jgi:glycosyltransferase involved in cell wall biosynthesis
MLVLAELAKQLPDVEMVLAGWETGEYRVPFRHRSLGSVSPKELALWMGRCDAALVLSLTNLSLLPLEAMACGCAVVSNGGPNVEWLLRDGENCLLAQPTPEGLCDAMKKLLEDHGLRQRLISNGLEQAAHSDWETEAGKLAACFNVLNKEHQP